jgi:hypothetical protein
MSATLEEMACDICLAPLNVLDGNYIHPLHRHDDGHQPVPVVSQLLDTIGQTCDFCGDKYPMWTLRGAGVTVLAVGEQSDLLQNLGETWAACVACTLDIESGHPHRAADRALRRAALHNLPEAQSQTRELHQAFLAQRQPGRTLITTTAWPESTFGARDLPKVRDRLTRLFRGPIELPTRFALEHMRTERADSLDRSQLYWVDRTFTDLAEHAATQLPAVTASRDLPPCDDGLLLWSRPVTARQITAASWTTGASTIQILLYRAIGSGLDDQAMQHLRDEVGWLAPMRTIQLHLEQPGPDRDANPAAVLLATWLLIAQKAAETTLADIGKTTRKSYARANRPLPDVRIVHIRPSTNTSEPTSGLTAPATTGRTHTSRVWVTGHWRNQPYGPGRTLRRPVYIHPFLRGPEDAPIKLSTTVRVLDNRATADPNLGPPE